MVTVRKLGMLALLAALVASVACSRKSDTALIESGKQYMAKKDYGRAALQFRNAIRANPKNAEAQYQLALAQIGFGDKIGAYRSLAKALDLNPKHMEAQLAIADLLLTGNSDANVKEAKEHAQAVLDASPGNPDALDAMALADLRLGNREEGLELLEQAAKKAPDHLQTAEMLVAARLAQNDKAGAEQILKAAIAKAPDSLNGHLMLGAFYLLVGKNQAAEQELRGVLQSDPNNALALLDLATVFNNEGRKNEAEDMYRRLSTGPTNPYRSAYGSYLFRIGKQKEGVAEFERLAKIDAKDNNVRARLVAAYIATKRIADALRVLKTALDKNPRDVAALLQRSEINILAGSYADARKDLNETLHFAPDSAKAHFLLASVEGAQGSPLKRRQELADTLRLDPNFFAARTALARYFIAEGQGQTAVELLSKAPTEQKLTLGFVENNNWALLASGNLKELRQGIDEGLARARTRDLLLQDAMLKLAQKHYLAARLPLREILDRNPEDLGAITTLVRSYAAENRLPGAVGEVRALLSKHPNSTALQYHLGSLLLANGQSKEARAVFTAIAGGAGFPPARLALATMDQHEGKPDAARLALDPLLASKSTELPARLELGFVEAKAGNYAKAIEHYRKVVDIQPQNVIALNNLAYLLADHTNEADEALKFAQKAKELAPDDVNVAGTIGWAYFKKGMYGLALQHMQAAVDREGKTVTDGTAIRRYHLAMAYKMTGDREKAEQALRSALKLAPNLPEAQAATQMLAEAR